ncbi:hypothetical protein B0H15DRAFT_284696 [Mycena belliarum]|uniref:MYND-type domain-containing protein n=1 Tax=Mycena belliarum TaxID=1033014 RepID=A0AAD6U4C4_9AGAR|nr:hypothetical protein B0H15DRAFT_284696 [Mycena belliae]
MRNLKKAHCSFSNFQSIPPQKAAEFVVRAIGDVGPDPLLPYCAQCIFGALHVIYPKDTVDAASEFTREADVAGADVADLKPAVRMQLLQRKHFHPFWTVMTRFLTVARDETQEIRFLFRFAGCFNCYTAPPRSPYIAEFHRIAQMLYPGIENSDGNFVMVCIHKMVSTLNDCLAMANAVKVAQNAQARRWPTSTKDIMPYGGKTTTHMLLRWANYTEDIAFTAFGILGHIVKICGTLIIDDITANQDVGEVFVSTGWRICRDATKVLCTTDEDDEDYSRKLAVAAEFRQRATFAAGFLEAATMLAPEIFPALIAGREGKMVQLFSLILEVAHAYSVSADPTLDAQFESFNWSRFSEWACQILADHSDLQPLLGKLHRDIARSQRTIEDPLDTVYRVLAAAKASARCHAPGCTESMASTGQEFKRCSACRVAGYCCKDCQIRAWKSNPNPHKRICAQIKALVDKGGGLDDRDRFVSNCRETKVSAEEVLEVARWDFNTRVVESDSKANTDGAVEFDELYWQLNPDWGQMLSRRRG